MASFERLALAALAVPLLGLGECGGGDTDLDPDLVPFECHLGTVDANGAHVVLAPGDPVELVLGFQGFLYVELLVGSPDAPDQANATMSITVEGADTSSGEQAQVRFHEGAEGAVSDKILLFLTSGTVDSYEGRAARVAVKLEGETKGCIVAEDVLLVDGLQ